MFSPLQASFTVGVPAGGLATDTRILQGCTDSMFASYQKEHG